MAPQAARLINVLAGAWLFLSAFSWPHTAFQHTNAWITGLVTVGVALIATGASGVRFVNTAVGAWLIISALALPTLSSATRWNNFLVGIVIGIVSLVGAAPRTTRREPRMA